MRLNEHIIKAKTKASSFDKIVSLNCAGMDLVDISILKELENLEVLSLSANHITSLEHLSQCTKLQSLYLRRNKIYDVAELSHLGKLNMLTNLALNENPLCESLGADYRATVLRNLPYLKKLDGQEVTESELNDAVGGGANKADMMDCNLIDAASSTVSASQEVNKELELNVTIAGCGAKKGDVIDCGVLEDPSLTPSASREMNTEPELNEAIAGGGANKGDIMDCNVIDDALPSPAAPAQELRPRDEQVSTVNQDSIDEPVSTPRSLQSKNALELELGLDLSELEDQGDSMSIGAPKCADRYSKTKCELGGGDLQTTRILNHDVIQMRLRSAATRIINNMDRECLEDVLILVYASLDKLCGVVKASTSTPSASPQLITESKLRHAIVGGGANKGEVMDPSVLEGAPSTPSTSVGLNKELELKGAIVGGGANKGDMMDCSLIEDLSSAKSPAQELSSSGEPLRTVNVDSISEPVRTPRSLQFKDALELELELDLSDLEGQGDNVSIGTLKCGEPCCNPKCADGGGDMPATGRNRSLNHKAIQRRLMLALRGLINIMDRERLEDVLIVVYGRLEKLNSH